MSLLTEEGFGSKMLLINFFAPEEKCDGHEYSALHIYIVRWYGITTKRLYKDGHKFEEYKQVLEY